MKGPKPAVTASPHIFRLRVYQSLIYLLSVCHRAPLLSPNYWHTSVSLHWVTVFFKTYGTSPTLIALLPQTLNRAPNVDLLLKLVPNKCTMLSC